MNEQVSLTTSFLFHLTMPKNNIKKKSLTFYSSKYAIFVCFNNYLSTNFSSFYFLLHVHPEFMQQKPVNLMTRTTESVKATKQNLPFIKMYHSSQAQTLRITHEHLLHNDTSFHEE